VQLVDFLDALSNDTPQRSRGKCKLQRWLDNEASEIAGRDEFLAALTNRDRESDDYRTNPNLLRVVLRMGLDISEKTLAEHRRGDCKCSV
jgi:hypothetical protein